jgi:hypothetical protein
MMWGGGGYDRGVMAYSIFRGLKLYSLSPPLFGEKNVNVSKRFPAVKLFK